MLFPTYSWAEGGMFNIPPDNNFSTFQLWNTAIFPSIFASIHLPSASTITWSTIE